jgi:hypothetical protein
MTNIIDKYGSRHWHGFTDKSPKLKTKSEIINTKYFATYVEKNTTILPPSLATSIETTILLTRHNVMRLEHTAMHAKANIIPDHDY